VGGYAKCTVHVGASTTCVGVDASTVTESMDCYDGTGYRYTNTPSYQIVDLSDAANPKVVPSKITFSQSDEAVSARAVGNRLFVTVKNLTSVAGDPRPYAKYYLKRVDLTNPSVPVIDNGINIPGTVQTDRCSRRSPAGALPAGAPPTRLPHTSQSAVPIARRWSRFTRVRRGLTRGVRLV
jgi:hypothetical protein